MRILIFTILFINITLLYTSTLQYIKLNEQVRISLMQANNYNQILALKIPTSQNTEHFAIEMTSIDFNQYNEIAANISGSLLPNGKVCRGVRMLACVLHRTQIIQNQDINIKIYSNIQGGYKLIVKIIKYQELKSQSTNVNFGDNFANYYQINLQSQNLTPQNIRFVLTPEQRQAYGHIYVLTQANLTQIHESIGLWKECEGLFLSNKQFKTHKHLYIWVVGDYNIKYKLEYEIINKDHHDLGIPQSFYELIEKNQQKVYHIKCQNLIESQEMIISIQKFAGNPILIFYLDFQMKQPLRTKYLHYMADSKFTFTTNQLKGSKNLYFKAKSIEQTSIFQIRVEKINLSEPQLLQENSYNFQSINKNKYLYFYLSKGQDLSIPFTNVSISFLYILGHPKVNILLGNSQSLSCLPTCESAMFPPVKNIATSFIALKIIKKLSIPAKEINPSTIVLIKLQTHLNKKFTYQINIEYSLQGKIMSLRENYPIMDILDMGQTKYYKYSPFDKSKGVKICVSPISGDIGTLGSYTNPLTEKSSSMTATKNCLYFDQQKIKKQVYISVHGISKSKYSVSIEVGTKNELIVTPTLETNQDVEYEVTITPLGSYKFNIHPVYSYLRIHYKASRPMDICILNKEQTGCTDQYIRKNEISGQIYDNLKEEVTARKIQVTNPSLTEKLFFKFKYHSGNYEHCEQKLLSQIYEEDISSNSCFQFELPSNAGNNTFQIMAKALTFINAPKIMIGICGNEAIKSMGERTIQVTGNQIAKHCLNQHQPTLQLILNFQSKPKSTFKFQYIVQNQSSIIKLAPNLKYTDSAIITQADPLRQFVMGLQMESNIIVFVKQLTFLVPIQVSVYIVDSININNDFKKKIQQIEKEYVGKEFEIAVTILAIDVKKHCERIGVKQCSILVVIEPKQRRNISQTIQYSIQFKNTQRQLKQYAPETSLLIQPGDSDIYSFYPNLNQPQATKYKGIVQISTHNQQCAHIFINRYDKLERSSSLVNQTASINEFDISNSAYLIEVEAYASNCKYSIQVFMIQAKTKTHISALTPEVHTDISISQNQTIYFIMDLQVKAKFRVLYVRRFGNIQMYAAQLNATSQKIIKNQSYTFDQNDFSINEHFPNILQLPSSANNLYILSVLAQSASQGSLILHNRNLPVTLPYWKKIVDKLESEQYTIFRFYAPKNKFKSGKIQLNLIHGIVNVSAILILDSNSKLKQQIQISESMCCISNKMNQIPFQVLNDNSPEYLQIKIINPTNEKSISFFEISMQLNSTSISYKDIDKNLQTKVQLIKGQSILVKSIIATKKHEIIVSLSEGILNQKFQNETGNKLASLLSCISPKISEGSKQIFSISDQKIILENVLIITVEWPHFILKQTMQMILQLFLADTCPLDNLSISLMPYFQDRLSLLMPFQWAYIKNQRDFAVVSKKQFFIDILSCSGSVKLRKSNSFSGLYKQNQFVQSDDFIKNQPHIYKITPNQHITYLTLQTKQATIRSILPNLQKDEGIGYLKYEWNYFLYGTDFKQLTLYLQPIKNISQTKTQVTSSKYLVRIISGFDPIHASAQCQDIGQKTVYNKLFKNQQNKQFVISISKQEILQSLQREPDTMYLSVDLSISLKTPQGDIQNYKFLAPTQKIPVQIFNITKLSYKIIAFGILTIIGIIFGCAILAQCFLKYVVPFLGRIKFSNTLIEQQNPPDDKNHEIIPPSSDRNKRETTEIGSQKVQTQQKIYN